ncbi:MAG TPA: hypothetical protein VME63_00735 [Dyella sp.]|uniref:hypothetical protein n=1 Tax=Dyella sp. TaxID=1869338 RepID=UPI002BD1565D|nr:hypothetical protein [Dyella sp.]HTV83902.1 hypothetical protein [Dyella sp.]
MELDDMKQAWQELSGRLDRQQALDWELWRISHMDRLRRRLQPLVWGQSVLLVLGVLIALWGIRFWSTHVHIWQALACGIAMQAFGTLSIFFPARVIAMVCTIDYAAPVLEIQRRIAGLRAWRVKVEAPVFGVLGSVIWIPALLMLAQYGMDIAGVDGWRDASGLPLWLIIVGAGSLAVTGLLYWLVCKLGRRRWLEDSIAGSSVKRAQVMLGDIARFEQP